MRFPTFPLCTVHATPLALRAALLFVVSIYLQLDTDKQARQDTASCVTRCHREKSSRKVGGVAILDGC